ncbi:MAG: indolepyruvate oxidoreductase subunit beta, partial [Paramuribaculum sp.]|nr:indolepyruvate oxidoreductase subunit beta [Paramuribaculum sp.]
KQAEVHGMSQRGGDVQSNLRISSSPIASDLIPRGKADLIVSLEPMEALRYRQWLAPTGWTVTNTAPFVNIPVYPDLDVIMKELAEGGNLIAFDVDEAAKAQGSPRTANMLLLGACAPFIGIHADEIEDAIAEIFGSKGQAVVDMNIKAFRAGLAKADELRKS